MGLLLLWLLLVTGLVCLLVVLVMRPAEQSWTDRLYKATFAFLVRVPPMIIFLLTNLFLLNGHPTVQFNSHSSEAMTWWSWWGKWWSAIINAATIQVFVYTGLAMVGLFFERLRTFSVVLFLAGICAALGYVIVGLASPKV